MYVWKKILEFITINEKVLLKRNKKFIPRALYNYRSEKIKKYTKLKP